MPQEGEEEGGDQDSSTESEDRFDVDSILGERMQKRKKQYYIKWKGYPDENDHSWEPAKNVPKDNPVLVAYLHKKKQTLKLNLKPDPYDVMVTGEKKEEFRVDETGKKWIESRLIDSATGKDKTYERVKFDNGYGPHRPSFTVSFKGYKIEENGVHKEYSNGMVVDTRGKRTFTILLGDDIVKKS